MGKFVADHFVLQFGVEPKCDLVRHRTRWTKQNGFFAKDSGRSFLQAADGRVFSEYIVADFSGEHGLQHAGCRFGDGVTAQIDDRFFRHRRVLYDEDTASLATRNKKPR